MVFKFTKKTHKGYANFLFYFMGYVSKRRLRTGAQYTPFKTGVSKRHFAGNMRPANMICVALNDFQNEQISQNNKFFCMIYTKLWPPDP